MAEGIMEEMIHKQSLGWKVDSAGTEYYHIGEMPDQRAIRVCSKYGIDITHQRARRITTNDFKKFDLIYALADDVLDEVMSMTSPPLNGVKIKLLMDEVYPGEHRSVPDPWYGREKDFEPVFHMIREACDAIVRKYGDKSR